MLFRENLLTYRFAWKKLPVLTSCIAKKLLSAKGEVYVTLDLGLSESRVLVKNTFIELLNDLKVEISKLSKVAEDEDSIYVVSQEGDVIKAAMFDGRSYYKLKPVSHDTAPTLEIDGIHMHRIVDVTPWRDSELKVQAAKVKKNMKVLDICTGLGYTAIISSMRGAEVLTIEKNPSVLEMASYNPWSKFLESPNIQIILGDALEVVKKLPNNFFDRIIHDPPRFSLAGELYSESFYRDLNHVLKENGILLHYVGAPGSKVRGIDLAKGVEKRLLKAGFRKTYTLRDIGCVLAYK